MKLRFCVSNRCNILKHKNRIIDFKRGKKTWFKIELFEEQWIFEICWTLQTHTSLEKLHRLNTTSPFKNAVVDLKIRYEIPLFDQWLSSKNFFIFEHGDADLEWIFVTLSSLLQHMRNAPFQKRVRKSAVIANTLLPWKYLVLDGWISRLCASLRAHLSSVLRLVKRARGTLIQKLEVSGTVGMDDFNQKKSSFFKILYFILKFS